MSLSARCDEGGACVFDKEWEGRLVHYMYVVKCADGTLYTGYSPDVEARVAAHNAGKGAKYTKTRRPVELMASAAFETKHEAMSAEWHFKRLSRAKKEALLACVQTGVAFECVLGERFDLKGANLADAAAAEAPADYEGQDAEDEAPPAGNDGSERAGE